MKSKQSKDIKEIAEGGCMHHLVIQNRITRRIADDKYFVLSQLTGLPWLYMVVWTKCKQMTNLRYEGPFFPTDLLYKICNKCICSISTGL
jgi:hypothetical protein